MYTYKSSNSNPYFQDPSLVKTPIPTFKYSSMSMAKRATTTLREIIAKR
jgi:hypothetical protein